MKKEPEFVTVRGRTNEAIAQGDLSESAYVIRKMRAISVWDLMTLEWRRMKILSRYTPDPMYGYESFKKEIEQQMAKHYQEMAEKYQMTIDEVEFQSNWRLCKGIDYDSVHGRHMRLISRDDLQELKELFAVFETSGLSVDQDAYSGRITSLAERYEMQEDEIDWQRKYRRLKAKV